MNHNLSLPVSQLTAGVLLEGVELRRLNEIPDQRGSFTETFVRQWGVGISPAQWSLVRSESRVLRGLHIHQRHDEYFCLIQGHCLAGLYDARQDSPTAGQYALYELFGTHLQALIFPAGRLHGWYFYAPSTHLQAVSESYCDYADDDNLGCRWNDPTLRIPWGISDPILSERAAHFPSLAELLTRLANAEVSR